MAYKIAEGHDVALLSLTDIDPQPRSDGLKFGRVTPSAAGTITREASYIELVWSVVESPAAYQDLLEQFGLDSATTAAVTLYALNDLFQATRYNGTAVRPIIGASAAQRDYFIRDVVIIVKDLAVAA